MTTDLELATVPQVLLWRHYKHIGCKKRIETVYVCVTQYQDPKNES